jgi:hypothetical protein
MRITIELDEAQWDRATGTIAWPGTARPFDGWVQLLQLLEEAVRSATPPSEAGSRDYPGANDRPDP